MSKKPVTPPTPRRINRPLAQPKMPSMERPLTANLMQRIRSIMERSGGKISNGTLAEEFGKTKQEICEWLSCSRSAPNSEMTIQLLAWVEKNS